jgi:SAM-dependent methyltransferase
VNLGGWHWDPSLYAGSAAYYLRGRVPYPHDLLDRLAAEVGLDGTGRLLDLGCGPGSLTLLLAPVFEHATGLDADPDMLAEGARAAAAAGITNIEWVESRAEELPADLGPFRMATLAQSFHWMDRPLVARLLRAALTPGGVVVHVHASTHQGVDSDAPLPHPRPPRGQIHDLVTRFLGPRRRAGQGTLPNGAISGVDVGREESRIYEAAGFTGPTRIEVPGPVVVRSVDDIAASVFSLSSAAPHLFGEHLDAFEADCVRCSPGTASRGSSASRCARS